jgi:RNA polymerase primary sigma factor
MSNTPMFDAISEREAQVIALRFGLDRKNKRPRTLQQVGNRLGLTRERIRQIQNTALAKMRAVMAKK